MRHNARVGTLTIASGQTDSAAITSLGALGRVGLGNAAGISIHGPAALTGTVTVQVQPAGDSTWRTLQSGGVDVTIAAGKTIVISPPAFADLRLHSGSAEGANRDFLIDSQQDMA